MAIEFVRDRGTRDRDPELQDAVAAEALRRGVIADSSTTSLNIQPSLVMPGATLERAFEIFGEAIEAALAAERG
jgi:4-aminobutyrate aminotransferase